MYQVTYNGATILSLSSQETQVLNTKGKVCSDNIYIKGETGSELSVEDNATLILETYSEQGELIAANVTDGAYLSNSQFFRATSLESVTLPNTLMSISCGAFAECSSLTNVIIPDHISTIDEYAFESCTSLLTIDIPESVVSIANNAFIYAGLITINVKQNYGVISNAPWGITNDVTINFLDKTVKYKGGNEV